MRNNTTLSLFAITTYGKVDGMSPLYEYVFSEPFDHEEKEYEGILSKERAGEQP